MLAIVFFYGHTEHGLVVVMRPVASALFVAFFLFLFIRLYLPSQRSEFNVEIVRSEMNENDNDEGTRNASCPASFFFLSIAC